CWRRRNDVERCQPNRRGRRAPSCHFHGQSALMLCKICFRIEPLPSLTSMTGFAMKTLALLLFTAVIGLTLTVASGGETQKLLRVCFISGSAEYESDKSLPILQKYLESKHKTVSTWAIAKSDKDLPGLENLDKCDVAILFTRRLKLEGDQLERIKKYCTSGKALVGIRTASHGIQTWLDLDQEAFGGT